MTFAARYESSQNSARSARARERERERERYRGRGRETLGPLVPGVSKQGLWLVPPKLSLSLFLSLFHYPSSFLLRQVSPIGAPPNNPDIRQELVACCKRLNAVVSRCQMFGVDTEHASLVVKGPWSNCKTCLSNCKSTRFEVRGTRYEVRGARCEVRGARSEARGTRYEVRGTRHEVRGTRYQVRGAR